MASVVKNIDNPVPIPTSPPCSCVFYSNHHNTCDFDFLRKYVSYRRVAVNCPRGITKRGKRSPKIFEYALLGELERQGKLSVSKMESLFPFLGRREIINLLQKLRRGGKASRLYKNVWKIGPALHYKGKINKKFGPSKQIILDKLRRHRMHIYEICLLFPTLRRWQVTRLLNDLRREGKASKLTGRSKTWKIGNHFNIQKTAATLTGLTKAEVV